MVTNKMTVIMGKYTIPTRNEPLQWQIRSQLVHSHNVGYLILFDYNRTFQNISKLYI